MKKVEKLKLAEQGLLRILSQAYPCACLLAETVIEWVNALPEEERRAILQKSIEWFPVNSVAVEPAAVPASHIHSEEQANQKSEILTAIEAELKMPLAIALDTIDIEVTTTALVEDFEYVDRNLDGDLKIKAILLWNAFIRHKSAQYKRLSGEEMVAIENNHRDAWLSNPSITAQALRLTQGPMIFVDLSLVEGLTIKDPHLNNAILGLIISTLARQLAERMVESARAQEEMQDLLAQLSAFISDNGTPQ